MGKIGVGDGVVYRDKDLRKEYGVFTVLPCVCPSCRDGNTLLVDLPSQLNEYSNRHVGCEMVEKV